MRRPHVRLACLAFALLGPGCKDDDPPPPPVCTDCPWGPGESPPSGGVGDRPCTVGGMTVPDGDTVVDEDGCRICQCQNGTLVCTDYPCVPVCDPETCPTMDGQTACCTEEGACGISDGDGTCYPIQPDAPIDPYCPPFDAEGVQYPGCCASGGTCSALGNAGGVGCVDPDLAGIEDPGACCKSCIRDECLDAFAACKDLERCLETADCLYRTGCMGAEYALNPACLEACALDGDQELIGELTLCGADRCPDPCPAGQGPA